MLSEEARSFVVRAGVRALAVLAFLYFLNAFIQTGYVSPMQAIVGVVWLALCYSLSRVLGVMTVLALSFAAMVLWGLFLESAPVSDFRAYYVHAARLSSGVFSSLFSTKSPPTVAYYAVFHWLLGPTYAANYIASAAAWTGGAAFAYRAVRPLVCDARDARFVCFGLALCPTFIVFSPVISSESVYFLLSAICAWLISRHLTGRGPFPYLYLAMGFVTAALFLTRTNGILALMICLAMLGMWRATSLQEFDERASMPGSRRSRQRLAAHVIVVISFVAVWFSFAYMSPVVLPNSLWPTMSWFGGSELRITASPWGSLSFLFGTNFDAKGKYNAPDLELAGYSGENRLTHAEAEKRAREIAVERITSGPVRFARFALSEKVAQLWGRDYDLYDLASGRRQRGSRLNLRTRSIAHASLDGVYRFTLLLFIVMLVREMRRPSHLLALGVIALFLSFPHVLLEVQPRYHLAMTPLIIVGATLLVLDIRRQRDEWLPAGRSKIRRWLAR